MKPQHNITKQNLAARWPSAAILIALGFIGWRALLMRLRNKLTANTGTLTPE